MSTLTIKDARDLSFLTRDQAVEIIIRLMEERDACVVALQHLLVAHGEQLDYAFQQAQDAIAKATGEKQ